MVDSQAGRPQHLPVVGQQRPALARNRRHFQVNHQIGHPQAALKHPQRLEAVARPAGTQAQAIPDLLCVEERSPGVAVTLDARSQARTDSLSLGPDLPGASEGGGSGRQGQGDRPGDLWEVFYGRGVFPFAEQHIVALEPQAQARCQVSLPSRRRTGEEAQPTLDRLEADVTQRGPETLDRPPQ